jgi:hypothetical protein
MKRILLTLVLALLCAAPAVVPTTTRAAGISIEIGDRPYYNRGPWYWGPGHRRLYWVPGHWSWRYGHRVWIHGHYVARDRRYW